MNKVDYTVQLSDEDWAVLVAAKMGGVKQVVGRYGLHIQQGYKSESFVKFYVADKEVTHTIGRLMRRKKLSLVVYPPNTVKFKFPDET